MKCHYEVLGLPREATAAEIKTSYRKLALQWHPDKNLDNLQEATEAFQLVQCAYEVLSEPQERAWYDSHREQIIRGAGSSYNDESLNVFPYFTPTCYKGFGDDPKGFYTVYAEVFSKLAAEETEFLDDPEDVKNIPMFGKSDTPYEQVHEFYAHWTSFSTSKSFVWLDHYDIKRAENRRVVKLMEKDNNKIRQKARKERNEEIRRLVSFVRRKDRRVLEHVKLLQDKAKDNKKKSEQARLDRLVQRQKDIMESNKRQEGNSLLKDSEYQRQLEEIEQQLQKEFGLSSDEEDTISEGGMESSNEDSSRSEEVINGVKAFVKEDKVKMSTSVSSYYCSACNKPFKNIKSFENHEKSKKHKENVDKMKVQLDIVFSGEESDAESGSVASAEENKQHNLTTTSPVPSVPVASSVPLASTVPLARHNGQLGDVRLDETITEDSDELEILSKSQRKKKNKKKCFLPMPESDGNDSHDEMSITEIIGPLRGRRAKKMQTRPVKPTVISSKEECNEQDSVAKPKEIGDKLDETEELIKPDVETEKLQIRSRDPSKEGGVSASRLDRNKSERNANVKRKSKIIVENLEDLENSCAVCGTEFSSKNKLFDHLKKTGHAVAKSVPPKSVRKGKKGVR